MDKRNWSKLMRIHDILRIAVDGCKLVPLLLAKLTTSISSDVLPWQPHSVTKLGTRL